MNWFGSVLSSVVVPYWFAYTINKVSVGGSFQEKMLSHSLPYYNYMSCFSVEANKTTRLPLCHISISVTKNKKAN